MPAPASDSSSRRLFLSMVSDEFRAHRELLTKDLERGQVEVATQEKFGNLGETTLEKLDHYIQGCSAVIHLVGDGLGHVPPMAAVDALLTRHPDFLTKLAAYTDLDRQSLSKCSYTQWEAYLAIYHEIRLQLYRPHADAPRQTGFIAKDSEKAIQEIHFNRLRKLGRDRDVFQNEERLSSFVLADLSDLLPPRNDSQIKFSIPRLRHAPQELIGREPWLVRLDEAWQDPHQHVVVVRAWGGVGKTSLVTAWMAEMEFKGWRGAERVFFWSFYSQGTRRDGDSTVSADTFIAKALEFFGDPDPVAGSPWDRGERLARLIAEKRSLLVLDGVEPMQHPPGPLAGQLTDPAVASLLNALAAQNPGLCIVTTRENITDLDGRRTATTWALDQLSEEAGASLLHRNGVTRAGEADINADDDELRTASAEVAGHALTLTLMGKFLALACDGDIRRRDTFRFAEADLEWVTTFDSDSPYGHAFKVIAAYERWFLDDKAQRTPREREECLLQLTILRLLGLFNRPASHDCLSALRKGKPIPGLTEILATTFNRDWEMAVKRLENNDLVKRDPSIGHRFAIDAHPLVREYFSKLLRTQQPKAFKAAHSRLFHHLCKQTEHRPDSLEGLQPLYQAVIHGCLAEEQDEACRAVYIDRILRSTGHNGFYSTKILGAVGADLGAITAFFEEPWNRPSLSLSQSNCAWLLNEAATRLLALGRISEAVEPMTAGAEIRKDQNDWLNIYISLTNLSELKVILGRLKEAEVDAYQAIDYIPKIDTPEMEVRAYTVAADALSHQGQIETSLILFKKAEIIQRTSRTPYNKTLYSISGFRYCDLMLIAAERLAWRIILNRENASNIDISVAKTIFASLTEVERRGIYSLSISKKSKWLLESSYDYLLISRVTIYREIHLSTNKSLKQNNPNLFIALELIRRASTTQFLPPILLTAALHHHFIGDTDASNRYLDEALRICERGPMPLYLADVHLHRARLFRDKEELVKAAEIIRRVGYGRRYEELADAEEAAVYW